MLCAFPPSGAPNAPPLRAQDDHLLVQWNNASMANEELLQRITVDPNICFGKPCVRGHRIWVSLILHLLAGGMTTPEVLDAYPGLEEADIHACLAYAAEIARERYIDIPGRRTA